MEVRLTSEAQAAYQRLPLVIRSRVAGVFERLTHGQKSAESSLCGEVGKIIFGFEPAIGGSS
jgi:hypothetical protein